MKPQFRRILAPSGRGETVLIDLRQAIVQANTNGGVETITFDKTVFTTPQTITLTGGQLELNDTTGKETITGPKVGVTVSGDGLSRVFEVEAGVTASISGLTIPDGTTTGNGGGLRNLGTATLSNCTVSGNYAEFDGGGLYTNSAGTMTLTNCTVTGNSASGESGGGGVANDAGSLTVDDSTFDANHAAFGGAIYSTTDYRDNIPFPSHIDLLDSGFTGNSAGNTGGAVSNSGGSGSISGCQFSGNRAGSTGGGGISV